MQCRDLANGKHESCARSGELSGDARAETASRARHQDGTASQPALVQQASKRSQAMPMAVVETIPLNHQHPGRALIIRWQETVARDIERRKDDGLQRRLHVVGEGADERETHE